MDQTLKGGGAVLLLLLSVFWIYSGYKNTRLGSNGNNGVTQDMPMPTAGLQKSFEQMAERHKNEPMPQINPDDPKAMAEMRAKVEEEISPAQKEEFRKMSKEMGAKMTRARQAMSPSDQARMRQKLQERFRGMRPGAPPQK